MKVTSKRIISTAATAAVIVGSLGGALAASGSASAAGAHTAAKAATLPAKYAMFKACDLANKQVTDCLYSSVANTFTIGSTTVKSNGNVTVVLSLHANKKTGALSTVAATLSAKPIALSGGIVGVNIPGLGFINDVNITPELAGTPKFNLENLELEKGPTITLPLEMSLSNPLLTVLGTASCTIGSTSDPVTVNATDGKTHPPAGTKSISGSLTKMRFNNDGVAYATAKLVDNTFEVPGATGCGGILSAFVDPIVNAKQGLPSAAGKNSAIMSGQSILAPASVLRKASS